jgi:hypothetical protein
MPSPNATPTPITPPRVPLVDSRTGLIDRAWYLFFFSLFKAAVEVYDNPNVAPNAVTLIASYDAALQELTQDVGTQPAASDSSANLQKQIDDAGIADLSSGLLAQIAEQQKQIDGLQLEPRSEIIGATGFFTTVDLKIVTVVNGIITSIV